MEHYPPILYAEDNANDIELTLMAFRECNLQNRIDLVTDGLQVLDYLNYAGKYAERPLEKPVVILLDIKMPKMDGIQVLRRIKSDENLKTIPVVMLTSSSMEQDLVESYHLGVNAYVVKPVDFLEFMEAVRKIGSFWALVNKTI
ncbi:MAG: response regulator [Bacteroidales bacterium]|nr:response regulator [Bacteroidales bacterium]HNW72462.1 response regulator [Bacteroidales bacterium]HPS51041.1 response regulator [Bacteroidales bacterium]